MSLDSQLPRLKSALWVQACVRRASVGGGIVTVLRKGDADSGTLLLKIVEFGRGCRVLAESRDRHGRPAWFAVTGPDYVTEAEAEQALDKARARDPDAWAVEIEHRGGPLPFDEPILKG